MSGVKTRRGITSVVIGASVDINVGADAHRLADQQQRSFSSVVNDALKGYLAAQELQEAAT